MRRVEASFPDSEFRVGIRSPDATHRSFFPGFGVPSWNMEFRWDASKLLFRIRSSEFDFGVPMGRIEASFPDSEFRVRFRSSDASHLASTRLPGQHPARRFPSKGRSLQVSRISKSQGTMRQGKGPL